MPSQYREHLPVRRMWTLSSNIHQALTYNPCLRGGKTDRGCTGLPTLAESPSIRKQKNLQRLIKCLGACADKLSKVKSPTSKPTSASGCRKVLRKSNMLYHKKE